jgi:hypothetical protein
MTPTVRMRTHIAFAALTGLILRVFFVLRFPVTDSGDAPFYMELAWNWLKRGVYGFEINGRLTPVDMRVPGYPAFLAAIFAFFGNAARPAMLAQAILDLVTCFVIALIAARLAPAASRRRVALAALWLAALCPFTANYTAVLLTETLTTFLTSLAILVLLETALGSAASEREGSTVANRWLVSGLVVGFATLVRPESPLLLVAAGIALLAKWWRPGEWTKLLRAGALLGIGLLMPLVPWAARNWKVLHDVQFLAPRYSELPGEYTPLGFMGWTNTWLWRFRDVYRVSWKADVEEISPDDLPPSAFDSVSERRRVADILERYNELLTITPGIDRQFLDLARERTARNPWRTFVEIPLLRALTLWFTPRVELLPYSGHVWPLRQEWEDDRKDLLITLALVAVNALYIALALVGAWRAQGRPGWSFLLLFILVRTFFFVHTDTPEPRYVLECFPAVIALAALAFLCKASPGETASMPA